MFGGMFIMALCIRKYFAEMSGLYKLTSETLETTGMHRFVRHPLYLGTLMFILSLSLFWPEAKNFMALFVLFIYTRVGIYLEEKKLFYQFGEEYVSYKGNVPMLIPRFQLFKKK
jgi:methanethiol S-methyltransferase